MNRPPIRAISIRQPWVELILRGVKKKEYRSMPTKICERVYIYAGIRLVESMSEWRKVKKRPGQLATGKIVGTVEIVDCCWDAAKSCYAYTLRAPKRLRLHREAKNQPQPRFWRPQF